MKNKISEWQTLLKNKDTNEVLSWALQYFGPDNIALSSSLGAEDQVLTDMLLKLNPRAQIFTLDTERLASETYAVLNATNRKYNTKIEVMFPDTKKVEEMEKKYGPNLFYESIDNRKLCCQIRKIEPLRRKLKSLKAWITGLRREQAVTRTDVPIIEWDEAFGLVKLNPLVDWTEEQVWDYIKKKTVPYNKLHDQGYPSIGCAPCTRAIKKGEDIRAGRWWWEKPEQKECGLHLKDGTSTTLGVRKHNKS